MLAATEHPSHNFNMPLNIGKLQEEGLKKIKTARTLKDLEKIRTELLGRKGPLAKITRTLSNLPPEERKKTGRLLNTVKSEIEKALEKARRDYQSPATNHQSFFDVTLPGENPEIGHLHPITQTIQEIEDIFHKLGFIRRRYPEVETDWHAFEGLNMPKNHPARDEWETFYLVQNPKFKVQSLNNENIDLILTPHTSSGQLREMERVGWPIRMINISRCDRRQSDINHIPTFYQFEGLVVDEGINITHLKGTLDFFVREYFGKERTYRLRPYDFRFTEPSFEIDVTCGLCGGKGCRYCKGGWAELGGAGMVHPQVLKNGGLDPKKVSGFAFGWGVERVLTMRVRLPDIRLLYQNDLRFLQQF